MKNSPKRSPRAKILFAGTALTALLAAPIAGSAASLSNSQFHIQAVNSEQPKGFSAIRPFFEGKKASIPTPSPTSPPVAEPTAAPSLEPSAPPTTAPPTTPAVESKPLNTLMTIDTSLPGCVPSNFSLQLTPFGAQPATLNWGDGSPVETAVSGSNMHEYKSGRHTVEIGGKLSAITRDTTAPNNAPNLCILSVDHFGSDTGLTNLRGMLSGANNLQSVAQPPQSVSSLAGLFHGNTGFNGDISGWNVSNVTNFSSMFNGASAFDQNLYRWDVSRGTSFTAMFSGASKFDSDLNSWNMSSATAVSGMFKDATSFTGNLSSWNVSNIDNFGAMFQGAKIFDGDLSRWNMSKATSLAQMFSGAESFRGTGLSTWNVTNVTGFSGMFNGAKSFNSDISSWNVSKALVFNDMFRDATSFQGNLSSWTPLNARSMNSMFRGATLFNSNLTKWNVTKVTDWFLFGYLSGLTSANTPAKFR